MRESMESVFRSKMILFWMKSKDVNFLEHLRSPPHVLGLILACSDGDGEERDWIRQIQVKDNSRFSMAVQVWLRSDDGWVSGGRSCLLSASNPHGGERNYEKFRRTSMATVCFRPRWRREKQSNGGASADEIQRRLSYRRTSMAIVGFQPRRRRENIWDIDWEERGEREAY